MKLILTLMLLACSLAGCTDAERSRYNAFGDASTITCWSGGQVVFTGESTGKVMAGESGGLYYMDKVTMKYTRIYADCIVSSK